MADETTTIEEAATQAGDQAIAQGQEVLDVFINSFKEMGLSIVNTLPGIITAFLLIIVGYLFFKLVQKILVATLQKIGADGVAERIGLGGMVSRLGIKSPPTVIFGKIIFWLLMLQFVMIVSEQLNLSFLSDPLGNIVGFLPKVITAFIIFVAGYIVSDLIRGAVLRSGERMGLDYARALSNLIYGFLFVVIIILAVRQLGIETKMLEGSVQIILGAVAVALALSLGLGLHTLARGIVSGVYARELYRTGSTIDWEGKPATVASVGAIATRLETEEGGFIMVPNHQLVSEVVQGKDG